MATCGSATRSVSRMSASSTGVSFSQADSGMLDRDAVKEDMGGRLCGDPLRADDDVDETCSGWCSSARRDTSGALAVGVSGRDAGA